MSPSGSGAAGQSKLALFVNMPVRARFWPSFSVWDDDGAGLCELSWLGVQVVVFWGFGAEFAARRLNGQYAPAPAQEGQHE